MATGIYKSADGTLRCACRGCTNTFVPSKHTPKSQPKRYCSMACRTKENNRIRNGSRTKQSILYDTCPHGHDRSPENVRYVRHPSGGMQIRCQACMRERQRARRAKSKAAA